MNISKEMLIKQCEAKIGKSKTDVKNTIEQFIAVVKDNIAEGNTVSLRGLGKFVPMTRKASKGRNFRSGDAIDIPVAKTLTFKFSKPTKLQFV